MPYEERSGPVIYAPATQKSEESGTKRECVWVVGPCARARQMQGDILDWEGRRLRERG